MNTESDFSAVSYKSYFRIAVIHILLESGNTIKWNIPDQKATANGKMTIKNKEFIFVKGLRQIAFLSVILWAQAPVRAANVIFCCLSFHNLMHACYSF